MTTEIFPQESPEEEELARKRNELSRLQSRLVDRELELADRQKRTQLMAEANAAYERGDTEALRRILAEYEATPESVQGTGVGANLVRIIRQIKQVEEHLAQIESKIATLIGSDIAKLKAKTEAAEAEGRDLLSEMAADLRGHVNVARSSFELRMSTRASA
jgi:hypothetical protein